MSYKNSNMSVVAYANGFTLWHYTTQDPMEKIEDLYYFVEINNLIRTGDVVYILTNGLCYQRQFVNMKDKGIKLVKLR